MAQRFNNGDTRRVDPVRLIIHGGSGAGKSNVIRAIAKHAEHLLRKAGHHPNKPRVVITAPTGMASSNVSGTTIHSGLGINTGHKLKAISEKKLDEMRCTLEDVKLIIVGIFGDIRLSLTRFFMRSRMSFVKSWNFCWL